MVPPLNVTVIVGFDPKTALQGFVVPVHVEALTLSWALQPPNVDPTLATALNVTVAALSEVEMLGKQVVVTVCEATFVPVPPHETGALTVPVFGETVTEPLPAPTNVRSSWRASVKVVCAVAPEVKPLAPRINFMLRS